MTEKTMHQHREEFEFWATRKGFKVAKVYGYDKNKSLKLLYRFEEVQVMWELWLSMRGVEND